ncbi:methyltransferase domain-containing protein [bacterium]|nr:methyltransferase domain-containing protein [bacterium]
MNNSKEKVERVFQSRKETWDFYNKISHFYDLLANWSEESLRIEGIEMLKLTPGERVLEIGFGTGHAVMAMAKLVGDEGRIYGVDISEEMVKIARRNSIDKQFSGCLSLVCGDASKLPLKSKIVDVIFTNFTLELFDTSEIPAVLSECMRVMDDRARILVIGLTKESDNGVVLNALEWGHRHFPNFLNCRPIYVHEALQEAGFQIQTVQKRAQWVPVEIVLGYKDSVA